jgi:hypothetical protein
MVTARRLFALMARCIKLDEPVNSARGRQLIPESGQKNLNPSFSMH